jgi:hypothetical protein
MMDYLPSKAIAYVNHGRWLADCPRPGCGNALELQPRQVTFHCTDRTGVGSCGLQADVEWPPNVQAITDELGKRPVHSTRNWAPEGHWQSIGTGRQTVRDLKEEFYRFDPGSAELAEYTQQYVDGMRIGSGINLGQLEHADLRQIES